MRRRTLNPVLWASLLVPLLVVMPGTMNATTPADAEALRQKTEEVEQLKRELDRRERELRELQQENERLRKRQQKEDRQRQQQDQQKAKDDLEALRRENERLRQEQERADRTRPAPPPDLRPTTPIQNLPPLGEGAVVEANELVAHFLSEPDPARRRYADRTFRVRGEVDRFERAMVSREFSVMLRSPDRGTPVKFSFNYVDQYRTVFTAKDGRLLVARDPQGRETTLFTVGDQVTLEGRCQGLKGGAIVFSRGQLPR